MPARKGPKNPRMITAQGETLTITEWAKRLNCHVAVVYARLAKGWTDQEAVTKAVIESGSNLYKHGYTGSVEHKTWLSVLNRCNDKEYKRYGARGIRVCPRWSKSFESFYEDMGPRPSAEHSIDRIDNDGDYACGKCNWCRRLGYKLCNCRWATLGVQARNRSNVRYIDAEGQILPLLEWAQKSGIAAETIWRRITKYGWAPEEAVTTPVRKGRQ